MNTPTLAEIQEAMQDYLNAVAEAVRIFEKGGVSDHYELALADAESCLKHYTELKEARD